MLIAKVVDSPLGFNQTLQINNPTHNICDCYESRSIFTFVVFSTYHLMITLIPNITHFVLYQ